MSDCSVFSVNKTALQCLNNTVLQSSLNFCNKSIFDKSSLFDIDNRAMSSSVPKHEINNIPSDHSNLMPKFYLLNPTSLAKPNALQLLSTEVKSQKIDFVLICETWFNKMHCNNYCSIEGYHVFRRDRRKRKGGGVCIYARDDFFCEDITLSSGESTADIEMLWLHVKCGVNNFIIGCLYIPPKPSYSITEFHEVVSKQLDFIINKFSDCHVVVGGDFNLVDCELLKISYGLTQVVESATHGTKILDKFFVSRPDLFDVTVCGSLVKTKHKAVILSPCVSDNVNHFANKCNYFPVFDKRQENIVGLRHLCVNTDWFNIFCSSCFQDCYDKFLWVLTNLICSAIPVKFIRVGSRDPPFMTPLVRKLLNDRNKMRRKGRITEADELAQKINTPIVKSRASSLAPMGEASIGDLWRETGKTINIKKCSAISFNPDAVNAHFSNISRGDESTDYDSFYVSVTSESYGGDDLIEPFTVERLLNKLKRTSPGRDNIPSWVFKTCSAELSQVICSLFNLSLNWGEVPWQWHDAIVIPIPKVLNPSALTDYRPISVTPILSRMLEKIIVKAFISPALDSNQARNQFAYKRTGSSTCALIYITHWVSVMLETSTYVRCLLIDFTKAFDIVDHTVLLNKLSKLCLPPRVFNWIVSFLRNRTQVVKINSAYSSAEPINKGVIQGSGLGPALFSVMVNDLQLRSVRNILCKFADDATALSPEGSDISLEMNLRAFWIGRLLTKCVLILLRQRKLFSAVLTHVGMLLCLVFLMLRLLMKLSCWEYFFLTILFLMHI